MIKAPSETAKQLGTSVSEVAGMLVSLDNDPDLLFVQSQASAGNRAAADVVASLATAWELYALATDAAHRLDEAVASRRREAVEDLLAPTAITLPDGRHTGLEPLVQAVRDRVDAAVADVARLAGVARQALVQLDAAKAAAGDLTARAAVIGASGDPEVVALGVAIERAGAAIVADPSKPGSTAGVERALEAARSRVDWLERRRESLPARLAAAQSRADEVDRLRREAAEALDATRLKIAFPVGLVEAQPAPPGAAAPADVDLKRSLGRARQQADSGLWQAAADGLDAWDRQAEDTLVEARRALAANAAPLAHRDELRGLAQAFRAKAVAHGRDEDGRLERLYQQARDLLYTAPCALEEAESVVHRYVESVNAACRGEE